MGRGWSFFFFTSVEVREVKNVTQTEKEYQRFQISNIDIIPNIHISVSLDCV